MLNNKNLNWRTCFILFYLPFVRILYLLALSVRNCSVERLPFLINAWPHIFSTFLFFHINVIIFLFFAYLSFLWPRQPFFPIAFVYLSNFLDSFLSNFLARVRDAFHLQRWILIMYFLRTSRFPSFFSTFSAVTRIYRTRTQKYAKFRSIRMNHISFDIILLI